MSAPGQFPANAAKAAKYTVLVVGSVLAIGPMLFALYTSFELPSDYPRVVSPGRLTLYNYRYVFDNAPVLRWYANTAFVTVGVIVGAVVVNTMAGYVLARIRFPGRTLAFLVVLAILMVPLQAILIPLYLLVAKFGWLNSYQALIVPFIANPFLIFLMRQAFQGVPSDLEEAAVVDGAGRFRSFLRIAVPLAMSGIATQAVLAGTWTWNSFMIPVTFTTDPDRYMMTVGMNSLQSQFYTLTTVQMAGVVLLTVPIVVMFVAFQRLIVPSFATAGIRG
ncbi:MAG TPA: carbohydrate ABC transporter permease [Acidimicrobiales bacterium]|nr:carbohydrate ABC transporter permease [Acidimicrobiales bacterium]